MTWSDRHGTPVPHVTSTHREGPFHRATCQCGWESAVYYTKKTVVEKAQDHLLLTAQQRAK